MAKELNTAGQNSDFYPACLAARATPRDNTVNLAQDTHARSGELLRVLRLLGQVD